MSIVINNLTVSVGQKKICENFNLAIADGTTVGLLGQNGCGKTTLLHTLAGLHSYDNGDILIDEKNLKKYTHKNLAQKLGILLQDTHLIFPQTVFEYCLAARHPHLNYFAWEKKRDHEITHAALKQMELEMLSNHNVHTLSGGEKRRLAIATLLAQTPQIYLLDEPTNHLDLHHQIKVLQHFKKLAVNENATVLMSLHDVRMAKRFCDFIILLFDDENIACGAPSALLTPENISRLFKLSPDEQDFFFHSDYTASRGNYYDNTNFS